jgi:hypothetical protein
MTTSDLEQTLAEARATAARRLEALRRLEEAHAGQAAPPEPVAMAQLRPAPVAFEPVSAQFEAPQAHSTAPDVVSVHADHAHDAPDPTIARAQPLGDLQPVAFVPVGVEPVSMHPQQPSPGLDYVPVGGVARSRLDPRTALDPRAALNPRAALGVQVADAAEAPPSAAASARLFAERMKSGLLASVATFRENRARSRALARAEANAEASGATRMPRQAKQPLTEKERRWERRRRRHLYEEILGWILVPTILVALYFAGMWLLDLFGTTPEALIDGMKTIWAQFR